MLSPTTLFTLSSDSRLLLWPPGSFPSSQFVARGIMFRIKSSRTFTLTCGGAALALFLWTAHMSTVPPGSANLNEHPHFYAGSRPQPTVIPVHSASPGSPGADTMSSTDDLSTTRPTPPDLPTDSFPSTTPAPLADDLSYKPTVSDIDSQLDSSDAPRVSSRPTPRMTLIVLWSPQDRDDSYLPNFFASAGANPSLDVLLIKFDKYDLGANHCETPRAAGVPNVREVCVDMDEYWDLHIDWLCAEWGCDARMRETARDVMVRRLPADRVSSSLALIFQRAC